MTRPDLVSNIREQCNLSRKKSEESLESILGIIKETLRSGEDVVLRKFGAFRVLNKAARGGRNPKTGEPAIITARRVVSFKKGKYLIEEINK